MKSLLACLLVGSGLASAATINIFSTGYAAGGGAIVLPTLHDGNWVLESGPGASVSSPFAPFVTFGSLFNTFPFSSGAWLKDFTLGSTSQWISPAAMETSSNPNSSTVPYIYQQTFDLTGLAPSTVVINGEWSADNYGFIVINGTQVSIDGTGADGIIPNAAGEFKTFTSFTLNSSNALFLPGANTIQFDVFNNTNGSPDVTGINVDILNATAQVIPEPATLGFMGLGLAALFMARRPAKR